MRRRYRQGIGLVRQARRSHKASVIETGARDNQVRAHHRQKLQRRKWANCSRHWVAFQGHAGLGKSFISATYPAETETSAVKLNSVVVLARNDSCADPFGYRQVIGTWQLQIATLFRVAAG